MMSYAKDLASCSTRGSMYPDDISHINENK